MRTSLLNKSPQRLYPFLVVLSAFAVYSAVCGNHFLITWDDSGYIIDNSITHGLTITNVLQAFQTVVIGNYAPLHLISYMVDFSLWGLNPWGYLFINVLLHALNGLIFYQILARYFLSRETALFASLIFIVHPVQVESVAWISERKNLLCMLFYLLAFASYLKADVARRHYFASIAYYLAALLTKPVAVVFPLLLLLHGVSKQQPTGAIIKRSIPFFAAAILSAVVTVIVQGPDFGGGRTPYYGGSILATAMTMLPVLLKYLSMIFFPVHLSADYLMPVRTSADLVVLTSGIALCLLIALGFWLFKSHRQLFLWYSAFFAALLPVSQIIPIVTLINDRYLYFPMLGAAPFIAELTHNAAKNHNSSLRRTAAGIAVLLLITCGVLSWNRALVWKDDLTLWQDAIGKDNKNYAAWAEYGAALNAAGQVDAALSAYKTSLSLNPSYWLALTNISLVYLGQNDLVNARHYIFRHIGAYPADASAYVHLGRSYYQAGYFEKSAAAYLEALKLKPTLDEPRRILAEISSKRPEILERQDLLRQHAPSDQ